MAHIAGSHHHRLKNITSHTDTYGGNMVDQNVFNTNGAAAFMGVSPSTLSKWRMTGGGPHYVQAGRRIVYRRQDIDAWLAARVKRSTSDPGQGKAA
jgi:predicted DNA-binding transcriptional regulator AlpA